MTPLRRSGFTLIEVLVALAVFGVMSMLAYAALGSTLSNADYLTERMERLQSIQRTMRYLSSDLVQAAPRPVRSDLGDSYVPAVYSTLSSDFALEITHGGWGNPAGLPRSTLQRVAYRIEEDDLLRRQEQAAEIMHRVLEAVLRLKELRHGGSGDDTVN